MLPWKKNLLFAWIGQFFSITGFSFAIPFAPFYLKELGITDPAQLRFWTGLFGSVAGLTMAISAPLWGYLADRWGKKLMTLRASLGGAVVLLGMGLSTSPEMLLFFRIIQGIFTGTITAYLTLVAASTPKERMGLAIGLMNSAVFCANSVSPLLGGVFADKFGYRVSFFIAAGLLSASFITSLLFVREERSSGPIPAFSFFSDLKGVILLSGVAPVVGMLFCYSVAQTIQRPQLPLMIQHMVSDPATIATQTGLVLSAGGVTSVLAGILIGNLSDRGNILNIAVMCSIAGGIFVGGIVLSQNVWQMMALTALFSFMAGGLEPILQTFLTRLVPPDKRGAAFGLNAGVRSFGWFIGSFSGGVIASQFGLPVIFVISTVMFFLIAGLLVLLRKRIT